MTTPNTHAALVDALKGCVNELHRVLESIKEDKPHFDGDRFHERLTAANAAIAAAEAAPPAGEPWKWAVREVGGSGMWAGRDSSAEARSTADQWVADGVCDVEVVPLYLAPPPQPAEPDHKEMAEFWEAQFHNACFRAGDYAAALELIATPKRPDGTWNRDRQACMELAAAALAKPTAPFQPPYPEGDVVGPCVCGGWPGGKCLKCSWIPAPAPQPKGNP